jgi:hypothetical protein
MDSTNEFNFVRSTKYSNAIIAGVNFTTPGAQAAETAIVSRPDGNALGLKH